MFVSVWLKWFVFVCWSYAKDLIVTMLLLLQSFILRDWPHGGVLGRCSSPGSFGLGHLARTGHMIGNGTSGDGDLWCSKTSHHDGPCVQLFASLHLEPLGMNFPTVIKNYFDYSGRGNCRHKQRPKRDFGSLKLHLWAAEGGGLDVCAAFIYIYLHQQRQQKSRPLESDFQPQIDASSAQNQMLSPKRLRSVKALVSEFPGP